MAATHWDVLSIEAAADDQKQFRFTVILDGPPGRVRVPVTVAALTCYERFQHEVLSYVGGLYRYQFCEGRAAPAADEAWKGAVAMMLGQIATVQATGGGAMN